MANSVQVTPYRRRKRRQRRSTVTATENPGSSMSTLLLLGGGALALWWLNSSGALGRLFGSQTSQAPQPNQSTQPQSQQQTTQNPPAPSSGSTSGSNSSGSGTSTQTPMPVPQVAQPMPAAIITVSDAQLARAATNREWAGDAQGSKLSVDQWNFYRALNAANAQDVPYPEDIGYTGSHRYDIITATEYWDALDRYHELHLTNPEGTPLAGLSGLSGLSGMAGWPDDYGFGSGFQPSVAFPQQFRPTPGPSAAVRGRVVGSVTSPMSGLARLSGISPIVPQQPYSVADTIRQIGPSVTPQAPLKGGFRKNGGAFQNRWKQ